MRLGSSGMRPRGKGRGGSLNRHFSGLCAGHRFILINKGRVCTPFWHLQNSICARSCTCLDTHACALSPFHKWLHSPSFRTTANMIKRALCTHSSFYLLTRSQSFFRYTHSIIAHVLAKRCKELMRNSLWCSEKVNYACLFYNPTNHVDLRDWARLLLAYLW